MSQFTIFFAIIVELLTSTTTHVRGKKRVAGVLVLMDVNLARRI